MDVLANFYVY